MKNIEVDENRRIFIGTSAVALCSVAIASAGLITPNLASAQSKASTGPVVIGQPDTKGIAVERVSYPNRNTDSHIAANVFKPADFTASTPVMYREGYEYYRTARGQRPNAPGRAVFSALPAQMAFFAFDQVETISPRPVLMIAGGDADSLYFSEVAYKNAKEPKELHWVPGATHIDLYDKPQYVDPAVAKLTGFFGQHLV